MDVNNCPHLIFVSKIFLFSQTHEVMYKLSVEYNKQGKETGQSSRRVMFHELQSHEYYRMLI